MEGERTAPWLYRVTGGVLCLALALSGCTAAARPAQLPTEHLATAIALTVAAGRPTPMSPGASPTPALTYTPTLTQAPATQAPARSPTSQPSATSTTGWSTRTPTLTPTPPIPFADIQILAPGPGSRVVSPIKLSAYLVPGARGNVTIELLGEDGRLLARTIKSYYAGTRVHTNLEIEFETAAVAEAARLQISTLDEWGRINALSSVDLLLLSIGDPDLSPPGEILEKIVILEPQPRALIQAKTVWVSGLARTSSSTPLIVEMIARDGKPLGPTKLVNLVPSDYSSFSAFSAELPYSVEDPTWVRLVVSELASRIPGATHLSSIEILLSP